ncbi:hypothetical protein LTR39_000764 [Cryomyces antarcticus]|nr:hypothetical protein LTR39_000764 [Cryomyces antarcticus]
MANKTSREMCHTSTICEHECNHGAEGYTLNVYHIRALVAVYVFVLLRKAIAKAVVQFAKATYHDRHINVFWFCPLENVREDANADGQGSDELERRDVQLRGAPCDALNRHPGHLEAREEPRKCVGLAAVFDLVFCDVRHVDQALFHEDFHGSTRQREISTLRRLEYEPAHVSKVSVHLGPLAAELPQNSPSAIHAIPSEKTSVISIHLSFRRHCRDFDSPAPGKFSRKMDQEHAKRMGIFDGKRTGVDLEGIQALQNDPIIAPFIYKAA